VQPLGPQHCSYPGFALPWLVSLCVGAGVYGARSCVTAELRFGGGLGTTLEVQIIIEVLE